VTNGSTARLSSPADTYVEFSGTAEAQSRRESLYAQIDGLQPSELFSPTFQLPDGSRSRLAERTLP